MEASSHITIPLVGISLLSPLLNSNCLKFNCKISNLGENMTTTVEGIVSGSMSFFTDIFKHLF